MWIRAKDKYTLVNPESSTTIDVDKHDDVLYVVSAWLHDMQPIVVFIGTEPECQEIFESICQALQSGCKFLDLSSSQGTTAFVIAADGRRTELSVSIPASPEVTP